MIWKFYNLQRLLHLSEMSLHHLQNECHHNTSTQRLLWAPNETVYCVWRCTVNYKKHYTNVSYYFYLPYLHWYTAPNNDPFTFSTLLFLPNFLWINNVCDIITVYFQVSTLHYFAQRNRKSCFLHFTRWWNVKCPLLLCVDTSHLYFSTIFMVLDSKSHVKIWD